jgi:hypothetical protein
MNIDYAKCPSKYMIHGLQLYFERGIQPGGFLQAVLANDFTKAATRADSANLELLHAWAIFVLNELPEQCWGSWETVKNWKGSNKSG